MIQKKRTSKNYQIIHNSRYEMCKLCKLKWSEKSQRYEGEIVDGFWLEKKKNEKEVYLTCITEISFDKMVENCTQVSYCPICGNRFNDNDYTEGS